MSYMFLNCKSLLSVDISKWNMNKVKYLYCMFLGYSSLYNISDISKLDTKKIQNMDLIFYNCKKLNNIPDIFNFSKYNKITITITYNIDKQNKIRIFGKEFFENNKKNAILLINDKFCELKEFHIDKKNEKFNIILIEKQFISNMSFMFSIVVLCHIYLIYQNGILIILMI